MSRFTSLGAALAATALLLTGCSSSDPLSTAKPASTGGGATGGAKTVTVGSAGFAESEIIAELYAQALEAKKVTVNRKMQIGARDVYIAALKDGSIDLVPEYTGNLLQYFDKSATAKTSAEVGAALASKTPAGFKVLTPAAAEDKDSYNVTADFSTKNNVKSLADLKAYTGTLKVGGNPELQQRPYGPQGLTGTYGVPADKMSFVALSDGGGPLTVKALKNGDVDIADIFSTTPAIAENGFVTLADPQNLILPQNVVPLVADRVNDAGVTDALNAVSAKLTTADLTAMNAKNMGASKQSPKDVAAAWLKEKGLA